ncbi:MAG: hypothetical protein C0501_31830 [Isosphaera sp.]|nr:hypothetical protein [Isosphaera sp.]
MRPVLRRVAVHGALTALVLGVVGLMLAELASIWLSGHSGTRAATGAPVAADAGGDVAAQVRARVPLLMAVWGFGFVAVGETFLHLRRGRRPAAPPAPPPDPAEKLLEEILAQVEAKAAPEPERREGDGVVS